LIKRFAFENTPPGKETSIISDENGSKLTFISGALQPMAKIEQLKGKAQTPETIQVNLTELIDVKGMKAMGNRVSQHTIQSITLIEPEPTEEEVVEETAIETTEEEIEPIETKTESVESTPKSVESPDAKPPKKIDFEITNPDDIDIDDKGQLGLF
jgi:topoisomerase-4 subunit A